MNLAFARKNYMRKCNLTSLILAYALHKRLEATRQQDPTIKGLTEFDADKTMRLLDKLWEQRPNKPNREKEGRLVDLCVNRHYNDKHGQRIAFPAVGQAHLGEGGPQAVLETIYRIDKHCMPSAKIFLVKENGERWGSVKMLEPQVSAARLVSLLRDKLLDDSDMRFLERFAKFTGALDENEMVALGRHENAEDTQISLIWEFARWQEVTLEGLSALARLNGDRKALNWAALNVWSSWSLARECRRKAGFFLNGDERGDRSLYMNALAKLQKAVDQNDEMREIWNCIRAAQPHPDRICRNPLVSSLQFPAFCCWSVSNYLAGTIKECERFKGTIVPRRLTFGREDTEHAFEAVKRLVCVPSSDRPGEFSMDWLNRFVPAADGGPTVDVAPSDLWDDSVDLMEFVSSVKAIVDWLAKEYLEPDTVGLREQEA